MDATWEKRQSVTSHLSIGMSQAEAESHLYEAEAIYQCNQDPYIRDYVLFHQDVSFATAILLEFAESDNGLVLRNIYNVDPDVLAAYIEPCQRIHLEHK
ncbi:MAG: hypothetical protein H0T73_20850 [Ardenticatenales bacterium]|nr:hypothetical protein [Ardenticatenales bacterium]